MRRKVLPRLPSGRVLALVVVLAGALVGLSLAAGAYELVAAREAGVRARAALSAGELDEAGAATADAARRFQRADRWLRYSPARGAGWVPLAGRNVRAASAMARSGALLTDGATGVIEAVLGLPGGAEALKPAGAAIPLEPLASLATPLGESAAAADRAADVLAGSPDTLLLAPVAAAREELEEVVVAGQRTLRIGAALTEGLPGFLGADGPRRYFLAAGNPAELRGAGGFLGAYSILTTHQGRVELGEFESIHDLTATALPDPPNQDFTRRYGDWFALRPWLNTNLSPDFPTGAALIERLYRQATGEHLDGVIVADPFAFQALMRLRGSVEVDGVGTVDADNVVEVVANRAYDLFESEDERKTVLGSVAIAGIEHLLSGAADLDDAMGALGEAAVGGHLLLYAADPAVQQAFEVAGVTGTLGHPGGDFLAVVGNNGAQNKADYYTDRAVRYRVKLHPGGTVAAGLGVRLANHTPVEGVGGHVIGPNIGPLEAGDNVTHLSVYCAGCELEDFDGPQADLLQADQELGYETFGLPVHLASSQTHDLSWSWVTERGWNGGEGGGTYRLTVHNQQTIRPTRLRVEVVPPLGMAVTRASPGVTVEADGIAVYEDEARGPISIEVGVAPPAVERTWIAVRDFLRRPVLRLDTASATHDVTQLGRLGAREP